RHGAVVNVEDVSFAVRVHCIEHRNRAHGHRGFELSHVLCLAHLVPLVDPSTFFEPRKLYRDWLTLAHRNDRAVMSLAELEVPWLNSFGRFHRNRVGPFRGP